MQKYYQLTLILLSLLSINIISCHCHQSRKPKADKDKQEQKGQPCKGSKSKKLDASLSLNVNPITLSVDKKTTKAIFTATDKNNATDLSQFKLQIDFTETGGIGSSITYINGKNEQKQIAKSFQENISHFFTNKELKANQGSIEIPFTFVPAPEVTTISATFKLLDKNAKILGSEYNVTWEKISNAKIQLDFSKLAFDAITGIITYNIQNTGTEEAKDIQLRYTNISNAIERDVLLNNQETATINFPSIPPQGSTGDHILPITFKTATKAKFRFEIFHKDQGKFVQEINKEEEFYDKAPKLNLTSVGPTELVGKNREFKIKIEKEEGSGNIDPSKLKLIITYNVGPDTAIEYSYNQTYKPLGQGNHILGTELGAIGKPISLRINPFMHLKTSFTIQLNYDGKNIGNPQTFNWIIDAITASKVLIRAVSANKDNNKIKDLLEIPGINVNIQYENGNIPLHIAVKKNNKSIIAALLANDANINAKNKKGDTPLYIALKKGDAAIIKMLLEEKNINIDSQDNRLKTLLKELIIKNSKEALSMLIQKGLDVNTKILYGNTLLHISVENGKRDIIDMLLKANDINVNAKNTYDTTPLHQAVEQGDKEILKMLLDAKDINPNAKDSNNNTPLYLADKKSNKAIMKLLIDAGADVNKKVDKEGNTLLHLAIDINKKSAFRALIETPGIKVNIKNYNGKTPLHIVNSMNSNGRSVIGRVDMINSLLDKEAEIDAIDNDGHTPLFGAIGQDDIQAVKLLIQRGANVNIKNNKDNNQTPLYTAIKAPKRHNKLIIQELLNHNAEINVIAGFAANTPLHRAIHYKNLKIIKLLLDKGAKQDIQDGNGRTALYLAQQSENPAIKELFGIATVS